MQNTLKPIAMTPTRPPYQGRSWLLVFPTCPFFTPLNLPLVLEPNNSGQTVTCMDAWIHEAEAFDLELGDAHIIRNAGGSAKEALRSLIVSQHFLETTRVWVVKHTSKLPVLTAI